MKNKVLIVLVISLMMGNAAFSQNQQNRKTYTSTTVEAFDLNKVYDKVTGSKIPVSDVKEMIHANPRLNLEREYDAEGKVLRYLYDPSTPNRSSNVVAGTKISEGSAFPNFKLTTIDGKESELNKLQGKLVILRFEMGASHFKKNEIAELDKQINALKNKENVEAIIIFQCAEDEIRKGFDLKDSNFKLVANGFNFIIKYCIRHFPSTLLIDQNGKLIKDYIFLESENIVLDQYIK